MDNRTATDCLFVNQVCNADTVDEACIKHLRAMLAGNHLKDADKTRLGALCRDRLQEHRNDLAVAAEGELIRRRDAANHRSARSNPPEPPFLWQVDAWRAYLEQHVGYIDPFALIGIFRQRWSNMRAAHKTQFRGAIGEVLSEIENQYSPNPAIHHALASVRNDLDRMKREAEIDRLLDEADTALGQRRFEDLHCLTQALQDLEPEPELARKLHQFKGIAARGLTLTRAYHHCIATLEKPPRVSQPSSFPRDECDGIQSAEPTFFSEKTQQQLAVLIDSHLAGVHVIIEEQGKTDPAGALQQLAAWENYLAGRAWWPEDANRTKEHLIAALEDSLHTDLNDCFQRAVQVRELTEEVARISVRLAPLGAFPHWLTEAEQEIEQLGVLSQFLEGRNQDPSFQKQLSQHRRHFDQITQKRGGPLFDSLQTRLKQLELQAGHRQAVQHRLARWLSAVQQAAQSAVAGMAVYDSDEHHFDAVMDLWETTRLKDTPLAVFEDVGRELEKVRAMISAAADDPLLTARFEGIHGAALLRDMAQQRRNGTAIVAQLELLSALQSDHTPEHRANSLHELARLCQNPFWVNPQDLETLGLQADHAQKAYDDHLMTQIRRLETQIHPPFPCPEAATLNELTVICDGLDAEISAGSPPALARFTMPAEHPITRLRLQVQALTACRCCDWDKVQFLTDQLPRDRSKKNRAIQATTYFYRYLENGSWRDDHWLLFLQTFRDLAEHPVFTAITQRYLEQLDAALAALTPDQLRDHAEACAAFPGLAPVTPYLAFLSSGQPEPLAAHLAASDPNLPLLTSMVRRLAKHRRFGMLALLEAVLTRLDLPDLGIGVRLSEDLMQEWHYLDQHFALDESYQSRLTHFRQELPDSVVWEKQRTAAETLHFALAGAKEIEGFFHRWSQQDIWARNDFAHELKQCRDAIERCPETVNRLAVSLTWSDQLIQVEAVYRQGRRLMALMGLIDTTHGATTLLDLNRYPNKALFQYSEILTPFLESLLAAWRDFTALVETQKSAPYGDSFTRCYAQPFWTAFQQSDFSNPHPKPSSQTLSALFTCWRQIFENHQHYRDLVHTKTFETHRDQVHNWDPHIVLNKSR